MTALAISNRWSVRAASALILFLHLSVAAQECKPLAIGEHYKPFVRPPLDDSLFRINVQFPRTDFRAGEAIPVKVTLRNVSGRSFLITKYSNYDDYRVDVFQSNGDLAPMTVLGASLRRGRQHTWGGPHPVVVKPLEALDNEIDITAFYILTLSGPYKLILSRETHPLVECPESLAWFRAVSEPVTFYITQ